MDFMDFEVPTKILPLKILSYNIIQCSTSAIHENSIHETAKFTHSMKILTLKNFRLYGSTYVACL